MRGFVPRGLLQSGVFPAYGGGLRESIMHVLACRFITLLHFAAHFFCFATSLVAPPQLRSLRAPSCMHAVVACIGAVAGPALRPVVHASLRRCHR
jgi:hypothetical protein